MPGGPERGDLLEREDAISCPDLASYRRGEEGKTNTKEWVNRGKHRRPGANVSQL